MTRDTIAILVCDGDNGWCGETAIDYRDQCASSVNGVPITSETRSPGWRSTIDDEDFCPAHTNDGTT